MSGTPTPAAPAMQAELAYLQAAGEDVTELRSELEQVLGRQTPSPSNDPAPVTRPELTGNEVLPVTEDGTIIDRPAPQDKPTEPPAPVPPPDKTAMEKALDPYAPDGVKPETATEEVEPGEVSIDAEGRVRDAKTGKYVPHAAMQQERIKRQQLEAELSKFREDAARANERLQVLTEIMHAQEKTAKEAVQKPAVEEKPEADIDPEVDIFGWARQQKARADRAEQKLVEIAQQNQQQYGELQSQQRFRQDVTQFASQTPEFFDSHRYVVAMRRAELQAIGFTDDNQINRQIDIEQRNLISTAMDKNQSPAQTIYKLALAKGFKPVKAEDTPAPVTTPAPAAPPPAPAAQAAPALQPSQTAVDAVLAVQNGVKASASLSGQGGSPGVGLTMQQLADMPQDQFDAFSGKIGLARLDALLRGAQ